VSQGRPVALVVDDAPLAVSTLTTVLHRAGYRVVAAGSAREAVAVLATVHPVVALLDRRLPDGDGVTLGRELRGHPSCAGARLVLLSGEAVHGDDAAAFDACLLKPASVRAVLAAVAPAPAD
jgi:CheY-like chemotaxis protein